MGYKVIIADDEKKIIQLIKQLGHWNEFDIDIIDECSDGDEALASIIENKPDFVFSDIKMPGCDGIQLIEKARALNLETLFVLLSGYRHFEYVRSAIQLNVVDYLLKPIEEKQLNDTIEKVITQLNEMKQQEELSKKLSFYEMQILQDKHKQFWDILSDMDIMDKSICFSSLIECNEKYNTQFEYSNFQMTYFETNMEEMGSEKSLFYEKVTGVIQNTFRDIAYVIFHFDYRGHYLVINFEDKNAVKVKKAISSVFYSIKDMNEIYGEFRIIIGCSTIKYRLTDLSDAFMEAMAAAWGRLIFWGNKILEYETIKDLKRFKVSDLISEQDVKGIQYNIKFIYLEELGKQFSTIYGKCSKYINDNTMDMLSFFLYLQKVILQCFLIEEHQELQIMLYHAYKESNNFQYMVKKVFICVENILKEKEKKKQENYKKPVEEAIQFIHKHYNELISLDDVANCCGITSTYLSRLFKEEVGMKFSDFLIQTRIEASKKLLEETKRSIKEIADIVGYADEKYFSKLFKKKVGIKPTDYRRLYY